jgi:hypothetical protein
MYAKARVVRPAGVLVVGPSTVFVDDIFAVLPALGETSVRLSALGTQPDLPRGWGPTAGTRRRRWRPRGWSGWRRCSHASCDTSVPRRVPDLVVARWGTTVTVRVTVRGGDLARCRSQVRHSARSHNGGRAAFSTVAQDLPWRVWERRPGATRTESDGRGDFEVWLRSDPPFRRMRDAAWPVLLPAEVMVRLQAGNCRCASSARTCSTRPSWSRCTPMQWRMLARRGRSERWVKSRVGRAPARGSGNAAGPRRRSGRGLRVVPGATG